MKYAILLWLSLLLTGCNLSKFVRGQYAYGNEWAIAKVMNDWDKGYRRDGTPKTNVRMNGHHLSFVAGVVEPIDKDAEFSFGVGPTVYLPEGKNPPSEYFGLEAKPRIAYTGWPVRPYLEIILGVGYLTKKWPGEATNFQFSIGGGLGVTLPLRDGWSIDAGYYIYHISNGSAIFGSPRPNVGYNNDSIVVGITKSF